MSLYHKLIKKVDRQRTVVFSKVATFLLTFFGCGIELSSKGNWGVFVDFRDIIKNSVNLHSECWFVLLLYTNQTTIL